MKNLKFLFFLWLIFGINQSLSAQEKKQLTIDDAVTRAGALSPKTLQQLNWLPNSDTYVYLSDDGKTIIQGSPKKKESTLLTLDNLNKWFLASGAGPDFKRFPMFSWITAESFYFQKGNKFFIADLKKKKINFAFDLPELAENLDIKNTENKLTTAYTVSNNLFLILPSGDGFASKQITADNEPDVLNGFAAHRQEFGISKGTFWSPKQNSIAFFRIDQRQVSDYPIINVNPLPAKDTLIKYPMAGGTSQNVTIGVYNINNNKMVYLETGEPYEQYLTNLSWSLDEKYIYMQVLNRGQNHMKMQKYDAVTGQLIKTLFEEKHEKYVEPLDPIYFHEKTSGNFLYLSQRDGYNHFYLYDTEGNLIRQITQGQFVVTDFLGFNAAGAEIFYTRTEKNGLEKQLYSANLANGFSKKISNEDGTHYGKISTNGSYVIDNYTSFKIPRKIDLLQTDGKPVRNLLTAKNPLDEYQLGKTKIFTLRADDGTLLNCRMIIPANFDSSKTYPSVTYVYGGPHLQLVTNSFLGGANLWMHYMASKGYVVFTMDNRGSQNRGRDFEQSTFRQLGTVEMADQLKGAEYLKKQSFIDPNRMGIHGWSFGGFMTTTLMLRSPGTYAVGVGGGPVIDWKYYEVMYTERYMDTPDENANGFETASLLNHADKLQGRLLLIHGTADDVVVWQHSLAFIQKSIEMGKLVDYFVYPGHKHNVYGPDRLHLMKKITQYFDDFLKDETPVSSRIPEGSGQ